jgi:hypothetical protein
MTAPAKRILVILDPEAAEPATVRVVLGRDAGGHRDA